MSDMVKMAEIARRLSLDLTSVRRFIAKEGDSLQIEVHRGKGDKILLTQADAEKLIARYQARRGPIANEAEPSATDDRFGFFYLIQLVPEAVPNRVKIGFADNVERRLGEHRTAAPTAKVLKSWPCKRSWDFAAMDCITRSDCKLVLNEVFEGEIQGFIDRADAFFAIMPNPDSPERELSEHSPLYDGGPRDDAEEDEAASAVIKPLQRTGPPQGNRSNINEPFVRRARR